MHSFSFIGLYSQLYHSIIAKEKECVCERRLTYRTHSAAAQGFSFMLYSTLSKGILTALVLNNVNLLLITSSLININCDSNIIYSFYYSYQRHVLPPQMNLHFSSNFMNYQLTVFKLKKCSYHKLNTEQ